MIRGSAPLACGQVVCLFCGRHTPVLGVVSGISLVRCRVCGQEAPYLAGEIVTFQPLAKSV
jgi:transcription elongation factor Elf1